MPVALSNVEQHTWMGYYIASPPGDDKRESDSGSGQVPDMAQQTIELRLSRFVGDGIHEDVDLTNFTQQPAAFRLDIEAEADFADQAETRDERKQCGALTRQWRATDDGAWELIFDYRAGPPRGVGARGAAARARSRPVAHS